MTAPLFTATADFPATESSAPRVTRLAVPSTEQRKALGINTQQDRWDLVFSARTATDRDAIYDFLAARGGTEPFTWVTPFGETASFVCISWDTTLDSCDLNTVQASFDLQYLPQGPNISQPAAPSVAFGYVPDFVASLAHDSRAQTIEMGDGYRQRFTFGLQPQEETWQLVFNNRTNAERDLIRAYLRGARGVTAFDWTDPRADQARRFVCDEWSIQYANFNNNNIQATFRKVFEPQPD